MMRLSMEDLAVADFLLPIEFRSFLLLLFFIYYIVVVVVDLD